MGLAALLMKLLNYVKLYPCYGSYTTGYDSLKIFDRLTIR